MVLRRFILLMLLSFLVFADEESTLVPVDGLEQSLLLDKHRRVSAFSKTVKALNRRDFAGALTAVKSLESNLEYTDYYHFLSGEAEHGRMRSALSNRRYANAIVAGEQAIFHFTQAQSASPYTTLQKRIASDLGETEISLADAYLKTQKRTKALSYLERGFQRLAQVNLMALVPKQMILTYALACEKKPTEICGSWVYKLSSFLSKSEDAKILERIAVFKKPSIERTTNIPYRIDVDLQAFQKGFTSYQAGKFEEAFNTWRDLLKSYPRTSIKLRTTFWMGRAAQKAKYGVQAETLFKEVIHELPFSYYALLSSWFGNIDIARMMDAELPLATAHAQMLTPADIVHVRRAETLISSGVPELALYELQDVRPSANMPNEFLVYLAELNHLAGNHLTTFQILSELTSRNFQGLFSVYGQKLYFPTERMPLINDIAKDHKVDPLLVLSIVKQESGFNPEAVSSASAYGLMQIIPPTARDMEPKCEVADLFDPAKNLRIGSRYIRMLLTKYHGNVIAALSAYNAGPGNSDRWMREAPPNIPLEEYIELIGFRETREYVENILRNYYWYNRRIRGETLPNLTALTQFVTASERAPARARSTKR